MSKRIDELKERISDLQKRRNIELTSEDISQQYVDDLNSSIQNCKSQISFLQNKPDGIINGR